MCERHFGKSLDCSHGEKVGVGWRGVVKKRMLSCGVQFKKQHDVCFGLSSSQVYLQGEEARGTDAGQGVEAESFMIAEWVKMRTVSSGALLVDGGERWQGTGRGGEAVRLSSRPPFLSPRFFLFGNISAEKAVRPVLQRYAARCENIKH